MAGVITVRFYGGLKQFGSSFELAAQTPAEAIYALTSQIDGLRKYIEAGVFKVRMGNTTVSRDEAETTLARGFEGTLHITPIAKGSKGGFLMTVIGVVLIAVAYVYGGPAGGQAMTAFWSGVMAMGVSLVLSGISQMLTKPPKLMEAAGASKNTTFSNLGNTVGQGKPIPVAYGICYAGSKVVSMGVETRKLTNEQIKELEKQANSSGNPNSNNLNQDDSDRKRSKRLGGLVAPIISALAEKSVNNKVKQLALDDPSLSESERQNRVKKSLGIPVNGSPESRGWEFEVVKTPIQGVAATAPNGERYNTDFNHPSVAAQNYKAEFKVDVDYQIRLKAAESGELRRKLNSLETEIAGITKRLEGEVPSDERHKLTYVRLPSLRQEVDKLKEILGA